MTESLDPQLGQLEALRGLLRQLGIEVDQLSVGRPVVPTFDEYVWQVSEAVSAGTRKVYSSY